MERPDTIYNPALLLPGCIWCLQLCSKAWWDFWMLMEHVKGLQKSSMLMACLMTQSSVVPVRIDISEDRLPLSQAISVLVRMQPYPYKHGYLKRQRLHKIGLTCNALLPLRPFCPPLPSLSGRKATMGAAFGSQPPHAKTSEKASNHSAMLTLVFICVSPTTHAYRSYPWQT